MIKKISLQLLEEGGLDSFEEEDEKKKGLYDELGSLDEDELDEDEF